MLRRTTLNCASLEPVAGASHVTVENGMALATATAADIAAVITAGEGELILASDTGDLYMGDVFGSYHRVNDIPRVTGTAAAVAVPTTAGNITVTWGTSHKIGIPTNAPTLWKGYGSPYVLTKITASGATAGDRVEVRMYGDGLSLSAEANSAGDISACVLVPFFSPMTDVGYFSAVAKSSGAVTTTFDFDVIALGSSVGRQD